MSYNELTVRLARSADATALARLALLDGARPLRGEILLAEVDGEPWAALSLADRRTLSDPFRPAAAARELLLVRARQLARADRRGSSRPARGRIRPA